MQKLDTDLSDSFDDESAQADDAELQYQHYELDDEYEVVINTSLDNEITVDCQQFVVLAVTYPVSELLSAVADERFDGDVPERATDVKVKHSNEDGDIGVTIDSYRDVDMSVDEAAETFAEQYE